MNRKAVWNLIKDAASEWWADNAPRLGAALAIRQAAWGKKAAAAAPTG